MLLAVWPTIIGYIKVNLKQLAVSGFRIAIYGSVWR